MNLWLAFIPKVSIWHCKKYLTIQFLFSGKLSHEMEDGQDGVNEKKKTVDEQEIDVINNRRKKITNVETEIPLFGFL